MACYSTVCTYVNKRRAEILAEAREGRVHLEGTVPQVHAPGAETRWTSLMCGWAWLVSRCSVR
jgi:hypothetical protein